MKFMRVCVVIILLFSGVGFIGCGGGGADLEVKARHSTIGQELIDLDKAYKDGIITEKEYKKSKERILKEGY